MPHSTLSKKDTLAALQMYGGKKQTVIAEKIGVSDSTLSRRISELQDAGVIEGTQLIVSPAHIGLHTIAFCTISVDHSRAAAIRKILINEPSVIELHEMLGTRPFFAKVVAPNNSILSELQHRILAMSGVKNVIVEVVGETIISHAPLPLTHYEE